MKAVLEFNLPEDKEDLDLTMQASSMHSALWETRQEVFRPARKHGYPDTAIATLLEKLDLLVETHSKDDPAWPQSEYGGAMNATDLIQLLEGEFSKILQDHKLEF